MRNQYYQIYSLLDQLESWNPRLDKIQHIIRRPDFHYSKKDGGDFILNMFLRSSYWLDKEVFVEDYLYKKRKQDLLPMQKAHLKMVDIGVALLEKGFPIKYNPSEYNHVGPDQLGNYVETFIKQCHKKYAFLHKKVAHKDQIPPTADEIIHLTRV